MQSMSGADAALEPTGTERDIVAGDCRTSAKQLIESSGVRTGVWSCTAGVWRSTWENWEQFTVLAGSGTLTDQSGVTHVLAPGAVVFIPAGSSGVWDVTETIRKSYVAPARQV